MDTERPHKVKRLIEPPTVVKDGRIVYDRAWLPLTEGEAELLETMTEEEKAHWFDSLNPSEKLRRYSEAERILDEMERKRGKNEP